MNDIAPRMACKACRRVLNRYVAADTGTVTYIHPLGAPSDVPDHLPEPVPADTVDSHHVCDFCSGQGIVFSFQTQPVDAVIVGASSQLVQSYGTDWAACIDCALLVQARDVDRLHARCADVGWPHDATVADGLRQFQQAVLDRLLPGRTVTDIENWPPAALDAASMPKVRDRLVQLLRSDDRLPAGLNEAPIRDQLADHLDTARLFWVDAEFTDVVRHAITSLPETHLTTEDAPAPHGLLAWAEPVGDTLTTVAVSWSCGSNGIHVVSYRSIGAGLAPTPLQEVREQIGWLVPVAAVDIRPDTPVDADSPCGPVAVTWLLVAQKLAETIDADVRRRIRKAYARVGRPAPDVRLVRIRGASSRQETSESAAHSSAPTDREFRWWVRGFWRNQPYGPGRAYRRLIYVAPHLRGPEDKPIRSSTAVRILGDSRMQSQQGEDAL